MLDLTINEITDKIIRDNFIKISEVVDNALFISGDFKHYQIIFSVAVTSLSIPHGLAFTPRDLIQTFLSTGTITWAYSSFDETNIVVTTSGALTVRFLLGRVNQSKSVEI